MKKLSSENGFVLPKTDKIYTEIEYEENTQGITRVLAKNKGAKSYEFRVNVNSGQLENILKSAEKSNMKQDVILSKNEQEIATLTDQVSSLITALKASNHDKMVLNEKVEGLEAENKELKAKVEGLEVKAEGLKVENKELKAKVEAYENELASQAELIKNPEDKTEEIKLSDLQTAVKEQMDKGLDSAAIAEVLQKPESTIKQSIAVINKKLNETGTLNG